MKNKKDISLEYLDITSKKDLHEVALFLQKEFKWDDIKSNLLENELPKLNKQLDTYGLMIRFGADIVGAVLFFHQGFVNIFSTKKPVINMSCLYVHEDFRGLPTISLLRRMSDRYENAILTNYSANTVAEKLLLAIGFKKMRLRRASLVIFECIFNFSQIKVNKIPKNSINIGKSLETVLEDGVGINFLELEINQQTLQLIVKKKILKRSILGINFNWKTATILWSSNETLVSKHWRKISHKLLIYLNSMKLICDFSSNFPTNTLEKENNYLIFSNDHTSNYIYPIQCEMNIFD